MRIQSVAYQRNTKMFQKCLIVEWVLLQIFKKYPEDAIVVNVSSKRKFKILSIQSGGAVFVVEVWNTLCDTCPDFQKNGTEVSCKHLPFFLMFILNQEGGVLNEQQIGDDDVKAMFKYNDIGNKYMKKDNEEME